jgi:hypothetical membrane protein
MRSAYGAHCPIVASAWRLRRGRSMPAVRRILECKLLSLTGGTIGIMSGPTVALTVRICGMAVPQVTDAILLSFGFAAILAVVCGICLVRGGSREQPDCRPSIRVMEFLMRLERRLLLCGALAGPIFLFLVVVQDYTRPGFDPRTHMLSMLALGDWGWVQIANFVGVGTLNVLYAAGLWHTLRPGSAGTAASILIAAYGLGLITVGIFTTDPTGGFPPGAAELNGPSSHGVVHALGALFVFVLLAASMVSLGSFFLTRHDPGWGSYCLTSALVTTVLFFVGVSNTEYMARLIRLATFVGWIGPSACAIKLLSTAVGQVGTSARAATIQ